MIKAIKEVTETTQHIADFYKSKGDTRRAEHFEKLAQGRLSYLSAGLTRRKGA